MSASSASVLRKVLSVQGTARLLMLALLVWCAWSIGNTIFDSLHTYGDSGAEAAALMGGRNFQRYGFLTAHLLPIHNSGSNIPFDLITEWTYDRYPPGPDIIVGILGLLGPEGTFWPYRILPIIFNLAAIYVFFRLVAQVSRSDGLALCAAAAYALNVSFMKMVDSFHYTGYAEILRFLVPLAAYRYTLSTTSTGSRRWLLLLCVASFVNIWITFDYVPANIITSFLLVALCAVEGAVWQRIRAGVTVALPITLATFVAMGTRLIQNGWAHGSVTDAVMELYRSLMHRVFNADLPSARIDLLEVLRVVLFRTEYSFGVSWRDAAALVLLAVGLMLVRKELLVRRYAALLVVLAAGNFAYMILLPAWAQEHYGLVGIRHVLPTFGLLIGGGVFLALWMIYLGVRSSNAPGLMGRAGQLVALAACLLIAFQLGRTFVWNLNETRAMWSTSAQNSWASRFAELAALREKMPPSSIAFGNAHWFRPEARYALDRFSIAIKSLNGLAYNQYWAPDADYRREVRGGREYPLLPKGQFDAFFVFYQRWDPPNDGFFPNFGSSDAEWFAHDQSILAWLTTNAQLVVSAGKWRLYRMVRLPTIAELAAAPTASGMTDESRGPGKPPGTN